MSNYFPNYKGSYDDYLCHHGILGMHWGVRRFQNKDGSLTNAGKRDRELSILEKAVDANPLSGEYSKDGIKAYNKIASAIDKKSINTVTLEAKSDTVRKFEKSYRAEKELLNKRLRDIDPKDYKRWSEMSGKLRNLDEQYIKSISSQVLKDIGYEDTERGRELIYSIIYSTKEFYR